MTKQTECPPLEQLAALADGELSPEEAGRIRVHLGECEDCFAVFADVAGFLEEKLAQPAEPLPATADKPARLIPRRKTVWSAWTGAIAAALLLALVVPRFWWSDQSETGLVASLLAAGATPEQLSGLIGPAGGQPGFSGQISQEALSFRLGVLLLDLQLGVKEGLAIDETAEETARLLEAAPELAPMAETLRAGGPEGAGLTQIESKIRGLLDAELFDLGMWTEGCRLAAATGNRSFFSDPRPRDFLNGLSGKPLPDWLKRETAVLSDLLNSRTEVDLEALEATARRVQALYGR